ncbi:MAG: hypothetical protein WAT39_09150, partial [Planctomycetota bacterium]
MGTDQWSPELARPGSVADSLQALQRRCDELDARLRALEGRDQQPGSPADDQPVLDADDRSSGAWLQHSGALRRIATISFVLVVALVLRTLTDAGIVVTTVGVWLGAGYALLLLGLGWQRFATDRAGKRVFTLCGALLLCSLVLETHGRFDLPAPAAHGLLLVALLASAALGLHYRSPITVELGVLGVAASAVALGFPRPLFPVAAG